MILYIRRRPDSPRFIFIPYFYGEFRDDFLNWRLTGETDIKSPWDIVGDEKYEKKDKYRATLRDLTYNPPESKCA